MSGGLSQARLSRLHDVMTDHAERGGIPGLVTAVSRRGELHVDAIGLTSIDGAPIRRDTIFRISSMTKPITAAATLILVEECKLRLDDPVDGLLPELANRKVLKDIASPLDDTVPANRPITVRDLLTFRMGFGIVMAMPGTYPIQTTESDLRLGQGPPSPQTPPAPDEWLRRLGTLPLMHQPGERWMYNTGSDVLGVLIARASGQPFEDFLRERLFDPLGMKDTAFSVPPDTIDRLATSYWTNWQTGNVEVYDDPATGQWNRPPAFPSGAGGLVSTIDDYMTFARMLLNKGKHGNARILSRPAVETMTTDQLTPEQKAASGVILADLGWGFGVSVVTRRHHLYAIPGNYGWSGGMGTTWQNDPIEDLAGILLTQQMWPSPTPPAVVLDFWTSTYQAIDD